MRLIFLGKLFGEEALRALGWTLFHSLWQGLLAALVAALIVFATRRSTALLRYNLLGIVAMVFLGVIMGTFFYELSTNSAASLKGIRTVDNVAGILANSQADPGFVTNIGALERFAAWFNENVELIMAGWALCFILHCLRLFTGLAASQRLYNYRARAVSANWNERLDELARQLGITQTLRILESGLVRMPVTIGFLRPVILVPLGLLSHLPPDQVQAILLHELAHIRRRDYLVNLVQRFFEAIFFFNPGILWISSLLRQEREACCDDLVLSKDQNKDSYIEALVSFHEYGFRTPGYAMGIVGKRYHLLDRVRRIVTGENRRPGLVEGAFLGAGLLLFSAFTVISKIEKAPLKPESLKDQVFLEQTPPTGPIQENRSNSVPMKGALEKLNTAHPRRYDAARLDTPKYRVTHYSKEMDESNKVTYEIIGIKGPTGTKYKLRLKNGNVVFLSINDSIVDKNELSNYSSELNELVKLIHPQRKDLPTEAQWEAASKASYKLQKSIEKNRQEQEKNRKFELKNKQKEIEQERKHDPSPDNVIRKISKPPKYLIEKPIDRSGGIGTGTGVGTGPGEGTGGGTGTGSGSGTGSGTGSGIDTPKSKKIQYRHELNKKVGEVNRKLGEVKREVGEINRKVGEVNRKFEYDLSVRQEEFAKQLDADWKIQANKIFDVDMSKDLNLDFKYVNKPGINSPSKPNSLEPKNPSGPGKKDGVKPDKRTPPKRIIRL